MLLDPREDSSRGGDIAQPEPLVACVYLRRAQPQPCGGTSWIPLRNALLFRWRAAFESPFPGHRVAVAGKVLRGHSVILLLTYVNLLQSKLTHSRAGAGFAGTRFFAIVAPSGERERGDGASDPFCQDRRTRG